MSVRRVVLLALAPAPALGCGNTTSSDTKVDAMTIGASSSSGGASSSSGASSSGGGGTSSGGCPPSLACDAPCGPVCDPKDYVDGGTGACAMRWIHGDGCYGGQVLFPCGLPALPQPPDASGVSQPLTEVCATYCMGSQLFNSCSVWADGGYVAADGGYAAGYVGSAAGQGGIAYYADAGIAPAVISCGYDCTGRLPATLLAEPPRRARTVGEVLARAAYLEAASVAAFLDLAAQVEAHGAPRALVLSLRRAARDEVRHARDVGALARARGAEPAAVRLAEAGPRSLLAIALENAREGCVRETWGAACAVAQSMRAADLEIRRAMRAIARDELRHASLSRDLAEWIASRLTPEECVLVDEQRDQALAELEADLEQGPDEAWRTTLGLPTRSEAQAILRGMHSDVWARAA